MFNKKNKFKVGDKVYINKGTGAGKWAIVKSVPGDKKYDICGFGDSDKGFILKTESGVSIWSYQDYCEPFIEPKFQKGYKFYPYPYMSTKTVSEVVDVKLNKKRKQYYYLCFDLDDGGSMAVSETTLSQYREYGTKTEKKVKEMTVAQISQELGYEVKIVK